MNNPLSYTARTFGEISADLRSKYPNRPDWYINMLAGVADIAHFYMDARAQDTNLITALSTEGVYNGGAFLDYYANTISAAESKILAAVDHSAILSYPHTVSRETITALITPTGGGSVSLYCIEDVVIPTSDVDFVEVKMRHGLRVDLTIIGNADGTVPWLELLLPDTDIQLNTLEVYNIIPGSPDTYELWEVKEDLINSSSADKHCRLIPKSDGLLVVMFGNGIYGELPNGSFAVKYARQGGIRGNVPVALTKQTGQIVGTSNGLANRTFTISKNVSESTIKININSQLWSRVQNLSGLGNNYTITRKDDGDMLLSFGDGTDGNIPSDTLVIYADWSLADGARVQSTGNGTYLKSFAPINNFTGGATGEGKETTKKLAPQTIKTKDRVVLEEDYETVAYKFNSNIKNIKVLPGYYGLGTVGIHIVPAGGGFASFSLKQSLQNHFISRSSLRSVDVRVRDPNYISKDITADLFLKPGSNINKNTAYGKLAVYLLVSESTKEIIETYKSFGIAEAVNIISTKWNFSPYFFSPADYAEVSKIIIRRERDGIPTFGSSLRPNDIISGLAELTDFDYATVATPSSIEFILFDQIMTLGTVLLNTAVS